MMEHDEFQVRLYGHTADNPDVFCEDLAQLLDISIEEAHALLDTVPAVVAETSTLEQAEYIRHRLTGIRALALVDGPDASQISRGEGAAAQTRELTPGIAAEARDARDDFMSRIWMLLLVGISGLALLAGSVMFLAQFMRMRAENVKATSPQALTTESESSAEQAPSSSEIEERKLRRIKALKDKISDLKFQTSWQKDMLKQAELRRPIDYDEMRRLKVQLAATEERIAAAFQELRKVRGR